MKKYIPVIIIVVAMAVAYFAGLDEYLTFDYLKGARTQLQAWAQMHPILAPLSFVMLYIVTIALSIPGGAVLSLFTGFVFGMPAAVFYVLFAATVGATAIFMAAKTAFGQTLERKAKPFFKTLRKGFSKNAWSYMLFLRLIPLFPFWLINVAPAFLGVRLQTYVWTTFVGIIPGTYVYTQTGAGLGAIFDEGQTFSLDAIFNLKMRIALAFLALLVLLPVVVKRFHD